MLLKVTKPTHIWYLWQGCQIPVGLQKLPEDLYFWIFFLTLILPRTLSSMAPLVKNKNR